jgi:hypothetical protein
MKYPYMVKVGDIYYPAGSEVPEAENASSIKIEPKEATIPAKKRGRPSKSEKE